MLCEDVEWEDFTSDDTQLLKFSLTSSKAVLDQYFFVGLGESGKGTGMLRSIRVRDILGLIMLTASAVVTSAS